MGLMASDRAQIGVIGSGMIGSAAARLFIGAGHEVAIANRRGPYSLLSLAQELGPKLQATTIAGAAQFGDIVLLAIPFAAVATLPAGPFAHKVVVDACNYYPQRDGDNPDLEADITTSSEIIAWHLPSARVVKSFNTMYYAHLAQAGDITLPLDDRLTIFVAGDDAEAKLHVGSLIDELGFASLDTGSLAEGGRRQQPGSSIYGVDLDLAQARAALSI
jgi:predicted dinucleotide-binding enzyme